MSTELAQAYAITVAPSLPGQVVAGRYRLEEVVGIGAHSTVYRACDERLSVADTPAHVAIKLSSEPMATYEFNRVRRIDHPAVVALRDRGIHEGLHFLVSDYVPGEDLTALPPPPPSPRAAAALIVQVCRGVAAAHARGITHGDIKPANILMSDHGPVVADFGGGRTSIYAPPEGGEPTPAGDVWSIGVVLEELTPDPPAGLRRIIESAKAADPQERPTASQLAEWLEAWIQRRPIPNHRVNPAERFVLWTIRSPFQFATVVLALLIAFGAGAGWQLLNAEAQRRADLQTEVRVGELQGALRNTTAGWARGLISFRDFVDNVSENVAAAGSLEQEPANDDFAAELDAEDEFDAAELP